MIRITRQTDYGIVILASMAGGVLGAVHTARDVAQSCHLPLPMVSKILKVLCREGLLTSHRGVKGGYSLAAPPEAITLADVIRVMEGPIGMTECTFSPGSCEHESFCPVRVNWQKISSSVRQALEKIPLSEMMAVSEPQGLGLLGVSGVAPWGPGTDVPGSTN